MQLQIQLHPITWLSLLYSLKQSVSLFQPFNQLSQRRGPNEWGSIVRIDAVLMSPCFSETWTGVTHLIIADSFSLSLRKLVYCKKKPPRKMFLFKMGNNPLHPLLWHLSITITSIIVSFRMTILSYTTDTINRPNLFTNWIYYWQIRN